LSGGEGANKLFDTADKRLVHCFFHCLDDIQNRGLYRCRCTLPGGVGSWYEAVFLGRFHGTFTGSK
jgi:hypothetical protein